MEAYNIIKRKLISFSFKQTQEFIYLLIDIHLSFFSVILSNKGYNKKVIYTYSIMINHFLALDLIKSIFAIISKNTKYCKDFNFKRYYSLDKSYIYIPNKVLQSGIIYYLGCLIIPIMMQKIINNIKKLYLIKRKIILNQNHQ